MSITALPTPPSRSMNPTAFADQGDIFIAALPTFVTEANALETNVNAKEASAVASASVAAASEAAATASRNATLWAAATNYSIGATVYSPISYRVYRARTAGVDPTDPSANPTKWGLVDGGLPILIVSGTTQTAVNGYHYLLTNVAATAVTLPSSPTAGDTVKVSSTNGLSTNSILQGGQTIMGLSETLIIDDPYATVMLRFMNSSWRLV